MLRRLYDWILAKAGHPHAQLWLALIAFLDGGLIPMPPHPLLGLMCLAEPRKAVRFAAITTVASICGGLLGYAIGHFVYDTVGAQLLTALGMADKFPKAACYLNEYGAKIIMLKALTPIPFILLSITAGFFSFPLLTFVAASLVSRGAVFLTVGGLFRLFGPSIKGFIDKYLGMIAAGLLVLIISGYVLISLFGGHNHASTDKCEAITLAAPYHP
jgi:membrane protein YqaA with SNARE-associated domain